MILRGFVLAAFILLPATGWAQSAISGLVKDTTGAVLPGVTVEAASPVLIEKVRAVSTDSQGRYSIRRRPTIASAIRASLICRCFTNSR